MQVLVLEKDASIQAFLEMALVDEGYEPLLACDGAEALIYIAQHEPAFILLDEHLPQVDCASFVEASRKLTKHWIPVILLDTGLNIEDIARNIGADAFLKMPFDLEELFALLDSFSRF
jgi:DNA-binding response OmpR family regulator